MTLVRRKRLGHGDMGWQARYLLICIVQQSKVKPGPTRTKQEGQELENSITKRREKAQQTPVAPSGLESKMQMAVQKSLENSEVVIQMKSKSRLYAGHLALAYLATEPANNHSPWYAKLLPEFWDKHYRGLQRPSYSQIYYWMQSCNPLNSCSAGAADTKQTPSVN